MELTTPSETIAVAKPGKLARAVLRRSSVAQSAAADGPVRMQKDVLIVGALECLAGVHSPAP
jgi:hypothetical protein